MGADIFDACILGGIYEASTIESVSGIGDFLELACKFGPCCRFPTSRVRTCINYTCFSCTCFNCGNSSACRRSNKFVLAIH